MAARRKMTSEWVVQGNYGQGWEDENYETTRVDGKRSLREYRANMPGYAHRLIVRRVPVLNNPMTVKIGKRMYRIRVRRRYVVQVVRRRKTGKKRRR